MTRAGRNDPLRPDNAGYLGQYATFLHVDAGDVALARNVYEQALAIAPDDANTMANCAKLLFQLGETKLATEMLESAETIAPATDLALQVELCFYRLAHVTGSWPKTLGRMRALIEGGARSPDWPLKVTVERALQDGHPNAALLRSLADVIANGAPSESLEEFPEWRA